MQNLILLTNDDGIDSPGLWEAARALSRLGEVVVAAPRHQYSGSGRSLPMDSDGIIETRTFNLDNQPWTAYAVGGAPAQVVMHALLEIMPRCPDLVVSGINYGENVGSGITISGTVGAALEAAAFEIPALAISLETAVEDHLSNSEKVDFSSAAHFTEFFSQMLLTKQMPEDVHVLKVDIPSDATPQTPWQITRQSMQTYFTAIPPQRAEWQQAARVGYELGVDLAREPEGTDIYVLRVDRQVSVTPLSLDLTSRVDFKSLNQLLSQPDQPDK